MDTHLILDSGNTAWMIVATLLVFMMTIPGIALFYGGLMRRKNMLSVVMQSLAIAGVVSILWMVFGYSFAFGTSFEGGSFFKYGIGGLDKVMLHGIGLDTLTATGIPELIFVLSWARSPSGSSSPASCSSRCCGACWSTCRWPTGCGAAAS